MPGIGQKWQKQTVLAAKLVPTAVPQSTTMMVTTQGVIEYTLRRHYYENGLIDSKGGGFWQTRPVASNNPHLHDIKPIITINHCENLPLSFLVHFRRIASVNCANDIRK